MANGKNTPRIDELMTGRDVARVLKCSPVHAYRLMRNGKIPTVVIGKMRRVRPADLEKFIQDHIASPTV